MTARVNVLKWVRFSCYFTTPSLSLIGGAWTWAALAGMGRVRLPFCRTSVLTTGSAPDFRPLLLCTWCSAAKATKATALKNLLLQTDLHECSPLTPRALQRSLHKKGVSDWSWFCWCKTWWYLFWFVSLAPNALISFHPQTMNPAPWVRWWREAFFLYSLFHS